MLAAALAIQGRTLLPKWALALIVLAGLAVLRLGSGNGLAHDLATAAAFFAVLQLTSDPAGRVTRILSAPWLVRIGLFSYSIYLVHAPLLHLSWFVLRQLGLSDDLNFVVLAVICLPLIVAVSYGFHCMFERPFMRLKPEAGESAYACARCSRHSPAQLSANAVRRPHAPFPHRSALDGPAADRRRRKRGQPASWRRL